MPQTESHQVEPPAKDQPAKVRPLGQPVQTQDRVRRLQQALAEKENQSALLEAEVERLRAEHRQQLLRKDERIHALEDQVAELTTMLSALRQPIVTGPPQYQDDQR